MLIVDFEKQFAYLVEYAWSLTIAQYSTQISHSSGVWIHLKYLIIKSLVGDFEVKSPREVGSAAW